MELFNIAENDYIDPDLIKNLRDKHGNAKVKQFNAVDLLADFTDNQEVENDR